MHAESDVIESLQQRLAIHRRTISLLEVQSAQLGAFTPVYIWHQFDSTRDEIARIKQSLGELGVVVDDQPGDRELTAPAERPGDPASLLRTYQRMLVDQIRHVALVNVVPWSDFTPRLAEIYTERHFAPLRTGALNEAAISPGIGVEQASPATLASMMQPAGARVMLEGPPGSGKSISLRALTLACALPADERNPALDGLAATWGETTPLPVLLNAREIVAALDRGNATPKSEQAPTLATFWTAIEDWLQFSNLDALVPAIQQLLEQGGCIILIDDIDNLPPTISPHAFATALSRFVARYPNNRFIITCRTVDSAMLSPLASFVRYTFAPLDESQIRQMTVRWYRLAAQHSHLLASSDVLERSAAVEGALVSDPQLRALAGTPLVLLLCVVAYAEGHALLNARAMILERLSDLLLHSWERNRAGDERGLHQVLGVGGLQTVERRLLLLERLALMFHSRAELTHDRPSALRMTEIEPLLCETLALFGVERHQALSDVIPRLLQWCCRNGLLVLAGSGSYTMPHAHIREYLAARALIARPDFPACAYPLRTSPHWRDVLLLAVQQLGRRSATNTVRALITQMLGTQQEVAGSHDLLFAAEALLALGEQSRADHASRAEVQTRLVALLGSPERPVAKRVRAGTLIGRLGDPRLTQLAPMVQVPEGPCVVGNDDGYEDEQPSQCVHVPEFSIGVYPVTNQEYALFLAAEQDSHNIPHCWHDLRLNNPSSPVVGVSWNQAQAYCAWLTRRLGAAGILSPGMIVRLPLEVEWEKAASWDEQAQEQRRYAWGNTWSSSLANTLEDRGDWMTAPVGCYPEGVSFYGLHDCTGNVWEWTASVYASYPGSATPFRQEGSYTLRGSSCASLPTNVRCSFRSRLPAHSWRYHLGFRIVIARPLAGLAEQLAPWLDPM